MQRGFTLIEALVAVALVLLCIGGAISGAANVGRYATAPGGPNRIAALAAAETAARLAQNVWKYGAPPGGPVPNGTWSTIYSGVPLTVAATCTVAGDLRITVSYPADPSRNETGVISLHTTLHSLAPRPGENVVRPGLVPAPTGAP
ncbi:MAG: prepilin-type N-terminal cleavage/methylation domain-containing protein [Candidatus Eremiobacteraeota bacterium]|nr:prepilin-type N-terminal cleavage/methylation domain-containing protein [Candidatus Eremiobacteraeota bacterium]